MDFESDLASIISRAGIDYTEARRRLELAAAQGHTECQAVLDYLQGGTSGGQRPARRLYRSNTEARRLLEVTAAHGNAVAQASLGTLHYEGKGGPQDFAEARRQYGLAAVQGNASAH